MSPTIQKENLTSVETAWNASLLDLTDLTDLTLVNQENESDGVVWLMAGLAVADLLVVLVNSLVLYWVKIKNASLVDRLILLDCVANVGGMLSLFLVYPRQVWGNQPFCIITIAVRFFFHLLNRVIPVTIAIYRYYISNPNR